MLPGCVRWCESPEEERQRGPIFANPSSIRRSRAPHRPLPENIPPERKGGTHRHSSAATYRACHSVITR
ncbi:hypothetical protein THAOC_16294 [Thalassiosira oceanica]|uniref:Uncharacterized protein n=1 Tax=Thalassiosira oceanica TaxID=159749 RepID=K0SDM2_THAOC|nr:hypothetical protein THAOC_16294 [Thalassiosira oceanica]|eukprot:EJK63069.1 hypothetical protein THAOC_16294 [Thalassiosira oceanica]